MFGKEPNAGKRVALIADCGRADGQGAVQPVHRRLRPADDGGRARADDAADGARMEGGAV